MTTKSKMSNNKVHIMISRLHLRSTVDDPDELLDKVRELPDHPPAFKNVKGRGVIEN